MSKPFKITIENGIAEMILDHPPVNAFDSAGWFAIAAELDHGIERAVRSDVADDAQARPLPLVVQFFKKAAGHQLWVAVRPVDAIDQRVEVREVTAEVRPVALGARVVVVEIEGVRRGAVDQRRDACPRAAASHRDAHLWLQFLILLSPSQCQIDRIKERIRQSI